MNFFKFTFLITRQILQHKIEIISVEFCIKNNLNENK